MFGIGINFQIKTNKVTSLISIVIFISDFFLQEEEEEKENVKKICQLFVLAIEYIELDSFFFETENQI